MSVFLMSPSRSFIDALAAGILEETQGDHLGRARLRIFVPNRRSGRMLEEAFLREADGQPVLLPRISPVGDIEEHEPSSLSFASMDGTPLPLAIDPFERRLLLWNLVSRFLEFAPQFSGQVDASQDAADSAGGQGHRVTSLRLADALGALLDDTYRYDVDLAGLADLAPEDLSEHWQVVLTFLQILREPWSAILAERGVLDPVDRQMRTIRAVAKAWAAKPPPFPIVAVGSSGAIPATAELLEVIAACPQGRVVIQGMGEGFIASEEIGSLILNDPIHPHYHLAHLLGRVKGVKIAQWPRTVSEREDQAQALRREKLLGWAFLPAKATHQWVDAFLESKDFEGLTRIDCRDPDEEALLISLLLRETLEEPDRTALVVTADTGLARRISAQMARYGVQMDDSTGSPLSATRPAMFFRLIARTIETRLGRIELLDLIKHPFFRWGMTGQEAESFAWAVDLALRGNRPDSDPVVFEASLDESKKLNDVQRNHFRRLRDLLLAFGRDASGANFLEEVRLLTELAEELAEGPERPASESLYGGSDGRAVHAVLSELMESQRSLDLPDPSKNGGHTGLADLISELFAMRTIHRTGERHQRIRILEPNEARLLRADRVIIAGLDEGRFPTEAPVWPFLSREMGRGLGLPPAEAQIGIQARDFFFHASARDCFLTRSACVGGKNTRPSRFLVRLDALARRVGVPFGDDERARSRKAWLQMLERQTKAPADSSTVSLTGPVVAPPSLNPRQERRPNCWSFTEVKRLRDDPYSVYARRVLGLYPLDSLEEETLAWQFGTLVHDAIEKACREWLGGNASGVIKVREDDSFDQAKLERALRNRILAAIEREEPSLWHSGIWRNRARRIAKEFPALFLTLLGEASVLSFEHSLSRSQAFELRGDGDGDENHGVKIYGSADLLVRLKDGTTRVIDFKTGVGPKQKEIESGEDPQLLLEAALADAGAFGPEFAGPANSMQIWRLDHELDHERETKISCDVFMEAGQRAPIVQDILAFLRSYQEEGTCFSAEFLVNLTHSSDYELLARKGEWS